MKKQTSKLMAIMAAASAMNQGYFAVKRPKYAARKEQVSPATQEAIKLAAADKREKKAARRYLVNHLSLKHNPCLINTGKNWVAREHG